MARTQINVQESSNNIVIKDNNNSTDVNVTQEITNVVTATTVGPQGSTGPQGPQGPQGPPGELSAFENLVVTGSLFVSGAGDGGSITSSIISASEGITGSLFGTASHAITSSFSSRSLTASFALNVLEGQGFPFTGSAGVSGSLTVDGPSKSHIEIGSTYNVGFDIAGLEGLQITGSGLIVSGAMEDSNHHNFIKIGDVELIDLNTDFGGAIGTSNQFLIHNVKSFKITSGSDGGNITTANAIFVHNGDEFYITKKGQPADASSATISSTGNETIIKDEIIQINATNGPAFRAPNDNNVTHFAGFQSNPGQQPALVRSVAASTFLDTVGGNLLASTITASDGFTASVQQNQIGFFGTASDAISSSRSITASHALFSNATNLAIDSISSSHAVTASFALNAGGGIGVGFPFTGSADVSGTLSIQGEEGHITSSGNISASGTVFSSIITSSRITASTGAKVGRLALTQAGSSTNTAIHYFTDPDTGIYFPAANNISLQAGGGDVEFNLQPGAIFSTTPAFKLTGNLTASGDISGSGTGSFAGIGVGVNTNIANVTAGTISGSGFNISSTIRGNTGSFAGGLIVNGGKSIADGISVLGEISASGGFIGTSSHAVTSSFASSSVSASHAITSSYALFALNAETGGSFPFTGSAEISGTLSVKGETGHITSSGNISASGTIIGSNLSGTNTGDQNISNLAVTASDVLFETITSSFIEISETGSVNEPSLLIGSSSGFVAGNKAGLFLSASGANTFIPTFTSDGVEKLSFGQNIVFEVDVNVRNNKLYFDDDNANTYIQSDSDTPENLEIHADGNIELRADDNLEIHSPISTPITASIISASSGITASNVIADSLSVKGNTALGDNSGTDLLAVSGSIEMTGSSGFKIFSDLPGADPSVPVGIYPILGGDLAFRGDGATSMRNMSDIHTNFGLVSADQPTIGIFMKSTAEPAAPSHITASTNFLISGSGDRELLVLGTITASGDISSSAIVTADQFIGNANFTALTASSATGSFTGSFIGNTNATGSFTGSFTGNGAGLTKVGTHVQGTSVTGSVTGSINPGLGATQIAYSNGGILEGKTNFTFSPFTNIFNVPTVICNNFQTSGEIQSSRITASFSGSFTGEGSFTEISTTRFNSTILTASIISASVASNTALTVTGFISASGPITASNISGQIEFDDSINVENSITGSTAVISQQQESSHTYPQTVSGRLRIDDSAANHTGLAASSNVTAGVTIGNRNAILNNFSGITFVVSQSVGRMAYQRVDGGKGDFVFIPQDGVSTRSELLRISGKNQNISASVPITASGLFLDFDNMPTTDPGVKGAVYRSASLGNQLFISAG